MKKAFLCYLLFCLPGIAALAQGERFVKDSLDAFVQRGMKDWDIPGLAIAVVKDGKIVVMKGYGERNTSTHEPVDENTLFLVASNTKLFTGTALAQLEYDGRLSLNDRITKYFPGFRVYDRNTTELVTIRDMLGHHLGTGTFQGDFVFWNTRLSRSEIMDRMQLLKPTGRFRQSYGYCNSCFLTAGEVIPKVSGKPWEVYVYDSLVVPAGMTNTHTLTTGIGQRPNASRPYTNAFGGTLKELPYDQVDNLGPAGSMVSCVKDMARWLMLQLDSGRIDGRRVLPWAVVRQTRDMNTAISSRKNAVYPIHFNGYGLGIFMNDYNGRQVFTHTGGAFGFVTSTCFIPEEKLGIVILTNNDNQEFFELLRYQLMDAYLGMPYTDRSRQQLGNHRKEMDSSVNEINAWKARVKGNTPPLPLAAFTGNYENELYGSITVSKKGDGLNIKFNSHRSLEASLQYMDNGEWLMRYNHIAFGIFATRFMLANGKVESVSIKASDFVEYAPYIFTKK
ncbi:serine hydrolase [Sediminibacterium soli]|uniref:serine hydrolase n=1 Tax=Sediminibacterium soli TaxID=2698829 RepID=UPI0013795D10|nr:serine hydrolase [Sediminibacterium soli]NCI46355.1 serine hydrolase [Sediminibacterium soli]